MHAVVWGLGLIGGSVAQALRDRRWRVAGYDADRATRAAAAAAGIDLLPADGAGMEVADVAVLAVPVDALPATLTQLAPRLRRARLVTDVGSTKRGVVAAATRLGLATFVGAHPLAGDHRRGWAAARPDLLVGAPVYLCPGPATAPRAVKRAQRFWRHLGLHPRILEPAAHDREVAWTSHLPQLAASALGAVLEAHGWPRARLGPGGRDTTRLAASDPALWAAIAAANADALAPALFALERELAALRRALRHPARLRRRLARARAWAAEERHDS